MQPDFKIVDVGANPTGGLPPYWPLIQQSAIVGFDPIGLQCIRKREQDLYLPYVIGDGQTHTFHRCAMWVLSSLFRPNEKMSNLFHVYPEGTRIEAEEVVQTHRLDDIRECDDCDFLKLDVQGAELMVLEHATRALESAVVVYTEVEFLPMYEGRPLFGEVDQFMRSRGFMIHKLDLQYRIVAPYPYQNSPNEPGSQLVWADATYIKQDWKGLPLERRAKLCQILEACFKSFDLVHRIYLESQP